MEFDLSPEMYCWSLLEEKKLVAEKPGRLRKLGQSVIRPSLAIGLEVAFEGHQQVSLSVTSHCMPMTLSSLW